MQDLVGEPTQRHLDVYRALGTVIDPELGIEITELGLIYKIGVDGEDVGVLMTLTVPGCPMHATISEDVERAVRSIPWVHKIHVELTFDPPWTPERLTEEARRRLGR